MEAPRAPYRVIAQSRFGEDGWELGVFPTCEAALALSEGLNTCACEGVVAYLVRDAHGTEVARFE